MKKITVAFIITCLFSSCFSPKLAIEGTAFNQQKAKVVLLGTEINPYNKAKKPKIGGLGHHEMIFNGKVKKRADEIFKMEKTRIEKHYQIMSEVLASTLNAEVVSLEEWKKIIADKQLSKHERSSEIELEVDYFPGMLLSEGLHPLSYKTKELKKLFKETAPFKVSLAAIAKATNADLLILSIAEPQAWGVGAFGGLAKMHLNLHLFAFNAEGELQAYVFNNSKSFNTNGKKVEDFMEAIDEFRNLAQKSVATLKTGDAPNMRKIRTIHYE